jgi:hypothetical protein
MLGGQQLTVAIARAVASQASCGDHGRADASLGIKEVDPTALAEEDSQRPGAAGNWRDKFLRGPYLPELCYQQTFASASDTDNFRNAKRPLAY